MARGPDRLWAADVTYVAIAVGFVYVAVIMDQQTGQEIQREEKELAEG